MSLVEGKSAACIIRRGAKPNTEKIEKILQDKERIQWFAAKYANAHDVFFVGRGVDYAVCLEGSLKLKEIFLYSF